MPVQANTSKQKKNMSVLTIRYGRIYNYDEIFEYAKKLVVKVMAKFSVKFLTR
jgi:hypothetical protein